MMNTSIRRSAGVGGLVRRAAAPSAPRSLRQSTRRLPRHLPQQPPAFDNHGYEHERCDIHQHPRRCYSASSALSLSWNPFRAFQGSSRNTSKRDAENSPRRIQERKDLIITILALEYRSLTGEEEHEDATRDQLVDVAMQRLEDRNIDELTTFQLRREMQKLLQPQVEEIFHTFRTVDAELPSDLDQDHASFQHMLEQEMVLTRAELDDPMGAPKGASPMEFLRRKHDAIQLLLNHRAKRANRSDDNDAATVPSGNGNEAANTADANANANANPNATDLLPMPEADSFGYHSRNDAEMDDIIRHYQTVNMCRAARLKQELGYCVVALQSSIPTAGRGVYVDGFAEAGSILAFQPGEVWVKEHLVNIPLEVEKTLEKNDNYQMSLRGDDHLIDSRNSPYTVLVQDNSNAFALGHVINHPSPTNPPNAKSAMLNFTKEMNLKDTEQYIPNTYARPPTLTMIGSLWEKEAIDMHGMCLVASRDLCNEEVFYDYRLQTSHMPNWYYRVSETEFGETKEGGANTSSPTSDDAVKQS